MDTTSGRAQKSSSSGTSPRLRWISRGGPPAALAYVEALWEGRVARLREKTPGVWWYAVDGGREVRGGVRAQAERAVLRALQEMGPAPAPGPGPTKKSEGAGKKKAPPSKRRSFRVPMQAPAGDGPDPTARFARLEDSPHYKSDTNEPRVVHMPDGRVCLAPLEWSSELGDAREL